jgi:hypothetical protein
VRHLLLRHQTNHDEDLKDTARPGAAGHTAGHTLRSLRLAGFCMIARHSPASRAAGY